MTTTVTFVSAVRPARLAHTNEWFVDRLERSLRTHGFDFAPAYGVFNGEEEIGFVVQTYDEQQRWTVKLLAARHGQEATVEIIAGQAFWVTHGERHSLGACVHVRAGSPPYPVRERGDYLVEQLGKKGWFQLGRSCYVV